MSVEIVKYVQFDKYLLKFTIGTGVYIDNLENLIKETGRNWYFVNHYLNGDLPEKHDQSATEKAGVDEKGIDTLVCVEETEYTGIRIYAGTKPSEAIKAYNRVNPVVDTVLSSIGDKPAKTPGKPQNNGNIPYYDFKTEYKPGDLVLVTIGRIFKAFTRTGIEYIELTQQYKNGKLSKFPLVKIYKETINGEISPAWGLLPPDVQDMSVGTEIRRKFNIVAQYWETTKDEKTRYGWNLAEYRG